MPRDMATAMATVMATRREVLKARGSDDMVALLSACRAGAGGGLRGMGAGGSGVAGSAGGASAADICGLAGSGWTRNRQSAYSARLGGHAQHLDRPDADRQCHPAARQSSE